MKYLISLFLGLLPAATLALRLAAPIGGTAPALHARPRAAALFMDVTKSWNTAIDQDGVTYYWKVGEDPTYEKPPEFDPSTAQNSGQYKGAKASDDLYDDQIPENEQVIYTDGTEKPTLSNTMRDKLIAEGRGLGADPNQKNPFLAVFGGVGVFVVLGALAINM